MSTEHPKVTVLMPVYNSEKYVKEAIESILNQTFSDFELLIFNDGSSDRSSAVIAGFRDPRIKIFDYKQNCGYLFHLNQGIRLARGTYIARMDADDISFPQRLERQVVFMDTHPEIGVAGSWVITIGYRVGIKIFTEIDSERLRCKLLFSNQFNHPTVIIRTAILRKYNLFYDSEFYHTEDYKLWRDISRYSKLANIPEILVKYRIHHNQISYLYQQDHLNHSSKVIENQLLGLGVEFSLKELEMHCALNFRKSNFEISKIEEWLLKLQDINVQVKLYSQDAFLQVLAEKWTNICLRRFLFFHWIRKVITEGIFIRPRSFLNPKYCLWAVIKVLREANIGRNLQLTILRVITTISNKKKELV